MRLIKRKRVEDALYEVAAIVERRVATLRMLENNVPRRENEIYKTAGEIDGLSEAARLILKAIK